MRHKHLEFVVASAAIIGLLGSLSVRVHAQTPKPISESAPNAPEKPYDWKSSFSKYPTGRVPRTPNGKPDLQGLWSFSILTPLERPGSQHKERISEEEAQENEDIAQKAEIELRVESTVTPPGEKTTDAYNSFWRDGYWYKVPMTSLHTSQVVDPPDGRVPPLTPAARERQDEVTERRNRAATGPEDRPLSSRCVIGFASGPPIIGRGAGSQEALLQIVQSTDAVVVRQEIMHDSQMIYLDETVSRPPESVHLNKGVARGHWEGDTLVVESTNFVDWASGIFADSHGTTEKLHVTERWKRLDDTHLLYGFTIDDPDTWTRPWSVEFVMWRLTNLEQLVEYACHEGNVGLEFSLSGARAKEKE